VVWRSKPDEDDHGSNPYTLARMVTATQNVDGTTVDVVQALFATDAKAQVEAWEKKQETGEVPATGSTNKFKLYNILPVTSSLQLQIFPQWSQPHQDAYDDRSVEKDPVFCQLRWDPDNEVAPEAFAPDHYYFWLNPIDFQMAGWVCRYVFDIPSNMDAYDVFRKFPPCLAPQLAVHFPAVGGTAPPEGKTRYVYREWLASYTKPDEWLPQIICADECRSIPYYMMTGSNTQPQALRTIDPSRPLPFGT
jgi:hypothetical protein